MIMKMKIIILSKIGNTAIKNIYSKNLFKIKFDINFIFLIFYGKKFLFNFIYN